MTLKFKLTFLCNCTW